MQYSNEVLDGIDIVNDALQELGKPTVFENPDIIIDEFFNFEDYLRLHFDKKNKENVGFCLDISDGIEVWLDRIPEAVYWSREDIEKDEMTVKDFIIMLLTSTAKADCYGSDDGSNYTKMYFYNDEGACMQTISMTTGITGALFRLLHINQKTIVYKPFYIK